MNEANTFSVSALMTKPIKSIAIIGDGLRAALPAAYLAARCGSPDMRITVISSQAQSQDSGHIITRPNIRRLHQLLKIPEKHILGPAKGRRLYAAKMEGKNGVVALPFGPYGKPYNGVSFLHQILCLNRNNAVSNLLKSISDYNLNLALQNLGDDVPFVAGAEFGYIFPRLNYGNMLQHYAQNLGAKFAKSPFQELQRDSNSGRVQCIKTTDSLVEVDCIVDVMSPVKNLAGWHENVLYIPHLKSLPGVEVYSLQAAMDRMSAFMPDTGFHRAELAEYNRVAELESQLIKDMKILLHQGSQGAEGRPTLARKVDVFAQRGRIPTEDYEVFTGPEWMAALMSIGLVPKHYDRLADAFPAEDLQTNIEQVEKVIAVTLRSAAHKRSVSHGG